MKSARSTIVVLATVAVASVGLPTVLTAPIAVVYNPSKSAPVGWYLVRPMRAPVVGNFLLIRLPPEPRTRAEQRGYLPARLPLLKRVAAIRGASVCQINHEIFIDGRSAAHALEKDAAGRRLTAWSGCRVLDSDEIFLLGSHGASFDSRYFGPVRIGDVIGRAIPFMVSQ